MRDTGIGIAAADQARIFDEFQQANHGALHSTEGTGLGLTLARRFVELHGGRIWLKSQPGVGSTFTISLPIGQEHLVSQPRNHALDTSASPVHV